MVHPRLRPTRWLAQRPLGAAAIPGRAELFALAPVPCAACCDHERGNTARRPRRGVRSGNQGSQEGDAVVRPDKPVGLISTAGGVQGLQAVNSMEFIARALRGWSVPLVLPVPRSPDPYEIATT